MQRRHPGHCFPRPAEERGCPAADRPRHRTRRASLGPRTHRGRNAGQERGLFRYQRTGRTRKETGVHRLQQKSGPGNHGARRGRNRHPRHTPRLSLHGRTRPARAFHGRAQTPHPVRRTAQFSTDEPGLGHYGQKHRPPLLPKRQRGILPPRNGGLDVIRMDWRPHQYLSDARARRRRAPAPRGAHLRLRPAPGERQKRILL